MKFSIVTPVLNGAKFLAETIRSVTSQTHRDFNYTIIDAGSEDGSVDIAEKAAKDDPRINIVQRQAEPLYESILWGLDQASGDYVSWINADDLYTPWALSVVSQHLAEAGDIQWLSGLPGCWDAEGRLCHVRPEGWRPRLLIKAGWFHKDLLGFIQQESIFFSRSLYSSLSEKERCSIASCKLAGDFVLWKAFAARTSLTTIPTILGGFRRHGENQSVLGVDRYMTEVKSAGAYFLPSPFRNAAQYVYRAASAVAAAQLSIKADASVNIAPNLTRP